MFAGEADPCRTIINSIASRDGAPGMSAQDISRFIVARVLINQATHPNGRRTPPTLGPDVMANVCSNYESVEVEVEAAALRAAVHSLLDENDARKNARAAARGTREHHHQAEAGSRLGG